MTVKRKDFQKAAAFIHEFLLKLNEEAECAELRDTLNLVLLHMQKYYRTLQVRTHEKSFQQTLSLTTRGLSPLTPFVDAPDKFQWKWLNLDSARVTSSIAVEESINFVVLPPMIQATKQGDLKYMLQLSQTEGSSVDDRDGIGRTSLMYAVHFGQLDALKILLQNDADPNATAHDGSTALHRACHDSNTMALHILLEFGGELGLQDSQGRAPLHWAVTTLSLDCLKLLLQYGADVTVKDKDGLTASMWACRLDHINHFELLSSADVNPASHPDGIERDNNGRTWMHWAIRRTEPLECLQTLLTEETAKIKDDDGKTVLLLAAEQGSLAACRVILDIAGPDRLRDQDDQERCAVHLAAIGGHGDVLNLLLERGADLSVHDKYAATAWDYAKNRQLHYCQLILLSHQRQRLESNPSTPNGLGLLDNQPFLNGGTEEENDNYMNMKNRGDFKPITPPHPPKRPRTGRTPLSRRASSLNMAATPDSELGRQRDVVSADNDRRKGRIEVTVQSRRPVSRQFVPSGRHEVSMSIDDDVQQGVHADEEVEEVMGGGMDVSDIDDDAEDTPHPSKPRPGMLQRRRLSGQGQTTPSQNPFTPQPPPFNKSLSSPAVSQSYTGPLQPSYNLANPAAEYMGPAPVGGGDMMRAPPTTPRHHIPSPPQRPGLTPLNRTPLGRVGGSAFVPTPPQSAAMNQSGLLPTPPSAGQRSDSPSRPGSGSSQDRDRPGSGGRPNSGSLSPAGDPGTAKPSPPPKSQPPGILEGKKIPPPMLTPLRNAPKPPPLDGHKGRKKKKKKRREGMMAASPLEGIPTPAPAEFGPQFNPPPPAASHRGRQSAAPPPPFQSKSLPQKAENSVDDVSHGSDEAPPMVSGHAYPIRNVPPRERSARPRDLRPTNQAHGEESMEVQGEADPDNNNDDISVVQLNSVVGGGEIIPEEEEEGVGPLIPPPQAFRGNSGQTRPLSQSIPQEGRSARLAAPSSAKPPLPRGRSAAGSASQTGTYRRHRGRPPTSKSGLF